MAKTVHILTDPITPLVECPIGLFISESGEICLKTEYANSQGRIDAYIVSSGEFFWGDPPQTIASQRLQRVKPFDLESVLDDIQKIAAFNITPDTGTSVAMQMREIASDICERIKP